MSDTNVVNVITTTESPNRIIITSARAPGVQQFLYQMYVFTVPGNLSAGTGRARLYMPSAVTFSNVRISAGTTPLGSEIIVDVNKNGSTVFTTQANRPKIFAGQTTDAVSVPDISEIVAGDYITVDIDAVGSIFAGSDLTVQIELTP